MLKLAPGEDQAGDEPVGAAGDARVRACAEQPRPTKRRDVLTALALGLVCFVIFNANLRSIPAADTYSARYLPFSILRDGTVTLNAIADRVAQGRRLDHEAPGPDTTWYILKGPNDRLVSFHPILVPVVISPLYVPAVVYLARHNWDPLLFDHVAIIMEKLSASLIAALSTVLIYRLLRRRTEPSTAVFLALVFALGTTTWTISSQALWSHGLGQLLVAATLLLLTGPCTPARAVSAGLLCALMVCNRPPDAILAAGLGLYGLWWAWPRPWPLVLATLPPLAVLLAYNAAFVGNIGGGYWSVKPQSIDLLLQSGGMVAGVAGLLFSPTRGLFVFSPFLLFLPLCMPLVLRASSTRLLTLVCGGAVLAQLFSYGLIDWRQGAAFGPRWLSDGLPILFWMLPPVWEGLAKPGRALFCVACLAAVAVEGIGAFWYTGIVDGKIYAADGDGKMRAAWDIRNAPFLAEVEHGPAPRSLLFDLRGSIDQITILNQSGTASEIRVEVRGWALTGGRTPADVTLKVDGPDVAGTSAFVARPDVANALGTAEPSGWTVTFSGAGLQPGPHRLAALVRSADGAEKRLLQEKTFTIEPPDTRHDSVLSRAASLAIERISQRQHSEGYWLTDFTGGTRFERSQRELNTFLNAVMIDLLEPIAEKAGLQGQVRRARLFLASQVEPDGLVRYHGLPDAKTIGTLGCAITPDADDTALAWRIAPPDDNRAGLAAALATLNQYRRADGLYRTWLAPQDRYQCIDPGQDANPADIAIQMHVLMLLQAFDPAAAKSLCTALQQRLSDDDIWVYYRLTGLMVALREIDIRAGCPLDLPVSRLRADAAGQGVWLDLIRGLSGKTKLGADMLLEVAANSFALVERSPPLLYHNDLSASVKRFYWSQDFAYALWLRAYFSRDDFESDARCRDEPGSYGCAKK